MDEQLGEDAAVSCWSRREFLSGAMAAGGATVLGAGQIARLLGRPLGDRAAAGRVTSTSGSDVLRVVLFGDPITLDPVARADPSQTPVVFLVNEPLYSFGPGLKTYPTLASAMPSISADGRRWRIPLRQGVRFSNGHPFSAADVKFTFDAIRAPSTHSANITSINWFDRVEVLDDHTVELILPQPYSSGLTELTIIGIVPSNVSYTPTTYADKLIGTGPFTFSSWQHGVSLTLAKNRDYWNKGLPKVDGIEFVITPTPAAAVISLGNGSVDLVPQLPVNAVKALAGKPAHVVIPPGIGTIVWAWPNWEKGHPTSNLDLRQAIAWAIDRQRIVDTVYKGYGAPESTVPSYGSAYYDAALGSTYGRHGNVKLAKRYATKAARELSQPLQVVWDDADPSLQQVAELLQENWAAIGIQSNLQQLNGAAALGALSEGRYDVYLLSIAIVPATSQAPLLYLPGSGVNFNHVDDPDLTRWSNAALHAVTADEARQAIKELQARSLQVVPTVPLVTEQVLFGVADRVHDFVDYYTGNLSTLARASLA